MNNVKIARELVRIARELVGRSLYQPIIKKLLRSLGRDDIDPRHVEGFLRLEFKTLDSLSKSDIKRSMKSIILAIDSDPKSSEDLAKSYGL